MMLIDYIVVENVFGDPDRVIEFAKRQEYFNKENHISGEHSHFAGLRTNSIAEIDPVMYHYINNEIFNKCTNQIYPESSNKVTFGFGFQTSTFFHILTKNDRMKPEWWHKDKDCIWAGVVYLNRNPEPNSGTNLLMNNNNIAVKNEFNKLVMYSPTYEHTSQGGFGNGIDDGRLTLTFFVNAFQFKIKTV